MFRTPAERRGPKAESHWGLRVTFGTGVVHWYPGGSPALAQVLFERNVPPDLRADPRTRAEYGCYDRGVFVAHEVVKEGQSAPNPK